MKNFRFLLLLPVLLITSCGDKYITERITEQVIMNTQTVYYDVASREWQVMNDIYGNPLYLFVDFDEPLLNNRQMTQGMMDAYLSFIDDDGFENLTPLPYDEYKMDNSYRWTEQITVEYSIQRVRFILKTNDFVTERPPFQSLMIRYAW